MDGRAARRLIVVLGLIGCAQPHEEATAVHSEELLGAFNVLTRSYDNSRSGANLSETILNTSNVNPNQFGRLFSMLLDDQIYAQPLYASSVVTPGGTFNLLLVATVNNGVAAFNADTGAFVWGRNFSGGGVPPLASQVANGTACGSNYLDYNSKIGIVGTPVIDGATAIMYFVTRAFEPSMTYRLHAIDIRNGSDRSSAAMAPVPTSPLAGFDPLFQNQRAGLALSGGTLYIGFASYCDANPYHGWLLAYDAATLTQLAAFNTTRGGGQGGIWQAGNAPPISPSSKVFVMTGNGTWDGVNNFGESLLRLSARTLALEDYFTPDEVDTLNAHDNDFGSAGPAFLPGGFFGISQIVAGGKDGRIFLTSITNLGHRVTNNAQVKVFQAVTDTIRPGQGDTHHIHNGVALWQAPSGLNLYVWGENDYLHLYRYNTTNSAFDTPAAFSGSVVPPYGMPGGLISISANGSTAGTGILWATTPSSGDANHATVPGILSAFNAENLQLLYQSTSPGDDMMSLAKYNPPLVANGKVYIASFDGVVWAFGPKAGPTPQIPNGTYVIRTNTISPNKCLDVFGGSAADGTNVEQYDCVGSFAQQWTLNNIGGNTYEVRTNTGANKCLDVAGGATTDGTNVQQLTCDGSAKQHWSIVSVGNGRYNLKPQNGVNKCLDVSNNSGATLANVQEWTCNRSTAQQFQFSLDGQQPQLGSYRIVTVAAEKCVDVSGSGFTDTVNVQEYSCNGTDAQRWRFHPLGGPFEIRAACSDKCLDVAGASTVDGTNVQQYACHMGPGQLWTVQSLGGDQYTLMPQTGPGECLDVANGGTANGTNIQQVSCHGGAAQSFRIIAP